MFVICDELSPDVFRRVYSAIFEEIHDRRLNATVTTTALQPTAPWYFSRMQTAFNRTNEVCIIIDSWIRDDRVNDLQTFQKRHLERWLLGKGAVAISENPSKTSLKTALSVIDVTHNNIIVDELVNRRDQNIGPGAGCWDPKRSILIVGERANHWDGMRYLSPFSALDRSGCSAWLTDGLAECGVSENRLYWVNAQREDKTAERTEFISELQPVQTFALGKVAKAWCDRCGIKHVAVDHPQYHKRFKNKELYPLLEHLKSL